MLAHLQSIDIVYRMHIGLVIGQATKWWIENVTQAHQFLDGGKVWTMSCGVRVGCGVIGGCAVMAIIEERDHEFSCRQVRLQDKKRRPDG